MSGDESQMAAGVGAGIETAALRKLIYQLAGNPDPDEVNVVQAATMAVDAFNDLEDENAQLNERVQELESATGINLENAEYKQLSRPAKIKRIREKLAEKAKDDPQGKAAMDYNDVMWLFDGHPSPGHASDLVTAAGDAKGYSFDKHEDRNNRVTVDREKLP